MKKTYILEDLDCAHCAGKIEAAIAGLNGVNSSTCTLLTQKLVVEYDESIIKDMTKAVKKAVKKYEPDVEVLEK